MKRSQTVLFSVLLIGFAGYLIAASNSPHNHVHSADHHGHAPWEAPSHHPDRIVVNWKQGPATSFSVTWRTDTTVVTPIAQLALADPAPRLDHVATEFTAETEHLDASRVVDEWADAHFHSVTFTDLLPDTLYAYRVGDGEVWSEWLHMRTASDSAEPFSFLYVGDAQNGVHSHWSRLIRTAYSQAPDARFIIHAGDLVNRAHRNVEWGEWFEAGGWIHSMLPSIPVPGNHEYDEYGGLLEEKHLSIFWRPQFTLPENGIAGLEETVFYTDYQGVRIIGMNSNREVKAQTAWLDDVLSNNPNRWTVVTFHHPVFSSSGTRNNPTLRTEWKPILEKHRVDLVLQGHDHTYARGRVKNETTGTNGREPSSGTVYVNSVSGAKMYEIKDQRWDVYGAEMERAAENTQLFQMISIAVDTLSFKAVTATGEPYDAFTLIKDAQGGPNRFVASEFAEMPERTHENTIPYN